MKNNSNSKFYDINKKKLRKIANAAVKICNLIEEDFDRITGNFIKPKYVGNIALRHIFKLYDYASEVAVLEDILNGNDVENHELIQVLNKIRRVFWKYNYSAFNDFCPQILVEFVEHDAQYRIS
jgi:hypothetical protein